MNKLNISLIFWMLFESALANPEQEAKAFAEGLKLPSLDQQKMLEELRQSNDKKMEAEVAGLQSLFDVEGDVGKKGEDPLKASLGKKNLETSRHPHINQPSLKEMEGLLKQKHRFKISYQDPIFKVREEAAQIKLEGKEGTPQKEDLKESLKASPQTKLVTCRQSAKPELKSCIKRLVLTVIPQPPITKTVTTYITVERWVKESMSCPSCEHRCTCTVNRLIKERVPRLVQVSEPQPPLLKEHWEGCEDLERRTIEGSCDRVESEEQNLNETRSILEYPSPVTRPHWSERHAFSCGALKEISECEALLQQGCEQVDSKCLNLQDGVCVEFENTFKCQPPHYLKGESLAFDLSTNTFVKTKLEPQDSFDTNDFGVAITQFNALTELGKQGEEGLGGIGGNASNPTVFNGKRQQCRINLGSFFRDCCKLKGILQGFLGGCNDEEKKLAVAAIKKKRCVKVEGRYCHKKVLKVCVEKRESYCCYGSQLARILQEIAHQQLGIPWGEAKNPNCGSLSAEQLSRINFDTPYAQAKLAELVPEIQASASEKFEQVNKRLAESNLTERLSSLASEKPFLGKEQDTGSRFLPRLLHQIRTHQIEPFKELIEGEIGGKIEAQDLQVLLVHASRIHSPRCKAFIEFLLSKGANPSFKDEGGYTAIDNAILTENKEALIFYKAKGLLTETHLEIARKHNKTAILEGLK